MPDEGPDPVAPKKVIPIDPAQAAHWPHDEIIDAEIIPQSAPSSDLAIATPASSPPPVEPGVIPQAPFAQVYAPPTITATPANTPYYPPAYPQQWPAPHVDYRNRPGAASRPAIVTTLGVTSIIVAALSFITSVFSGCTSLVLLGNARRTAPPGTTATAITTPAPAPAPNPLSLSDRDRRLIIQAFKSKARNGISRERERQLDAMLVEHGKEIFNDDAPLSIQPIIDHTGKVFRQYADSGKIGADTIELKQGPLVPRAGNFQLQDTNAVFRFDDASPALRVAAKDPSTAPIAIPESTLQAVDPLDEEESAAVIARIKQLSSNLLNANQSATLSNLFQSSNWTAYLTPSPNPVGLTSQVKSVVVQKDGTATITFINSSLTLDAKGQILTSTPMAGQSGALPSSSVKSPVSPTIGLIYANPTASGVSIIESFAALLLAIFLLVAAILCLRQSPVARKLYLWYALLKLATGIVGLTSIIVMLKSITVGKDPIGIAQSIAAGLTSTATVAAAFIGVGILYPVFVLLVLYANKSARDYFRTAQ